MEVKVKKNVMLLNKPLGNGRSTVVSIRSVPRLLVSLTGGAGGLSSSLDIFFSKYTFFPFFLV